MFSMNLNNGPIVVGGGPIGLSTAIMLAKKGFNNVKVYERLPEYPRTDDNRWLNERSYIIGINGRGQNVLNWLDVMNKVEEKATTVVGRRDWSPQTDIDSPVEIINDLKVKKYYTKCMQRDLLAACLLEEIYLKYNDKITVRFDVDCKSVNWKNENKEDEVCELEFSKTNDAGVETSWTESSSFVIGADGAASVIRNTMSEKGENGFNVKAFPDKNVRIYKTIPLKFPQNSKLWRKDLNYSVRTKSDINLDALPTKDGTYLAVLLFRPWDNRLNIKSLPEAKSFFNSLFPMFSSVIKDEDLADFVKKDPVKLPKFMYCGPVLHKGRTTCLLGDAIHTVKPYFGQGLNSGLEDVKILSDSLSSSANNVPEALKIFSKRRSNDVKALVKISKQLDGGFLTFVLPLIVDGILHKLAPFFFNPNSIAMLQNEKLSFSQIQFKKRKDRFFQLFLLGGFLSLNLKIFSLIFGFIFPYLSKIVPKKLIF
jgi:2-polyprenyl-6-methoxyphenol hydroxylase-like FAD-dependent oxidoreductase